MVGRKVTVIPATINSLTRSYDTEIKKRRTAAYARVSTDSDEQFTSYEAQIDYYTQYIKNANLQDSLFNKNRGVYRFFYKFIDLNFQCIYLLIKVIMACDEPYEL